MRTCDKTTLEKLTALNGSLPKSPTWLKLAINDCILGKSIAKERESRMLVALGFEPLPVTREVLACPSCGIVHGEGLDCHHEPIAGVVILKSGQAVTGRKPRNYRTIESMPVKALAQAIRDRTPIE